MADDRSNINSASSQRITTDMTLMEQKQAALFANYLIKPENVMPVWEFGMPQNTNPGMVRQKSFVGEPKVKTSGDVKKLILEHVEEISEQSQINWRTWDENENRFESGELKWISDYVIAALCFAKSDLKLDDCETIAHVVQVLWKTLDLLNMDAPMDLKEATQTRNSILQSGLARLFDEKILNKVQVRQILEYAKRTIFGHLQLYLACIGMKKQATRTKKVEIFAETPKMCEMPDLETNCKEILENGRAATPEELLAGETAINDQEQAEDEGNEEDEEDIVDPNDPMYGLEARLSQLDLDEESKIVLKKKLLEASNKIKEGLDKRQVDLDTKLASLPANQRKR